MIDLFRSWISQIIGYAEALQDGTFESAWAEGNRSRTSVYYSGELYEQVFGDLDADSVLDEARRGLAVHPAVIDGLHDFLLSLKRLDEWVEAHVDTKEWGKGEVIPTSVRRIFSSQEWRDANTAAGILVAAAKQAGFSGKDFDPTQTVH